MPMIVRNLEQARRLRMMTGRALAASKGEEYAPENAPKYGPHKSVAPGREPSRRTGRPKNAASMDGVERSRKG